MLLPQGSLPLTVKGTVQRGKAEALFQAELHAIKYGPRPPSIPIAVEVEGCEAKCIFCTQVGASINQHLRMKDTNSQCFVWV